MTAYKAMVTVLDINETLIELRDKNSKENFPDQLDMKVSDLLRDYRDLLTAEMKATTLEVFNDNK